MGGRLPPSRTDPPEGTCDLGTSSPPPLITSGWKPTPSSIIDEMRDLSAKNEEEITAAVEDGKRRFVALQTRAAALPAPAQPAS